MLGIFNIFSLLYLFRGLQLGAVIWRERQALFQEPLTRHKKHLGEQASFFIAVPPGVFIHELGHALAIWLFGGQVVEFGYRVFWGYVVPQGSFNLAQEWFIALAGTLGNLVFGAALWLLLRGHSASSLRYFALRAFRFQLHFALIYYPVFTLFLPIGDWTTIYDFQATPVLSGATAVVHAVLLGWFWWADRAGVFEMPGYDSAAEQEAFAALRREAAANPHDTRLQLQFIDTLRRGGTSRKARRYLNNFLKRNPDSAEAYLQLAVLQSQGQPQVSRPASQNAEKALHFGLSNPRAMAVAHQILGRYYLDRGQGQEAAHHLSQAIATTSSTAEADRRPPDDHSFYAQLYHLRSQAYRRLRQYDQAYEDVQKAIDRAQAAGDERAATFYRSELEVVEKHAGRLFGAPPTDLP
ncbi:MAG TPA: M50 family metallopeptidase [Anaerolineae bacterium]